MKILIIFLVIVGLTAASVTHFSALPLYTSAISIPTTKLYHNQDSTGQYSYGYSGGPSTKSEHKSADGITRGIYSYFDADDNLQTVQYTADALNGFRVAATNLPVAPTDDKKAPEPVHDTPEVTKAKAEHMKAFEEAEMRASKDDESQSNDDNNESYGNNNDDDNGRGNEGGNDDGSMSNENMNGNSNQPILPADTTMTSRNYLASLDLNDLRPVNIPTTSYIRVSTPLHAYTTRIYRPEVYSYPWTKSYSSEWLPQYLRSGHVIANSGDIDNVFISSAHN